MNDQCKECGGKCCKTLVMARPAVIDEILATRVVGSDGAVIWIDSTCKYLVDGQCSIYADRPEACRTYEVDGVWCKKTREVVA